MAANLPIVEALPALRAALRGHRNVVLQAPPGAGKSTRVPLELLAELWVGGRRILMLEPRRLATRAIAARLAHGLDEEVGRTIGYRMRLETRVSASTRIEVLTEGVLTSILQRDPALEDVAAVIFDEFHERSLNADLGLALCLDVQSSLREDLRLLVMSATLAAEPVAALLSAPIVRAEGRSFPVTLRYLEHASARTRVSAFSEREPASVARRVAGGVRRALDEVAGDVLVFLPGGAEIRQAQRTLGESGSAPGVDVLPLFGDLAVEDQDRALQPAAAGRRKVILATNIAETGLTIDGIHAVVDAGLVRRARFDPASGMSRLETLPVSRASAEQRAGRAGRIAPGVCYRLWAEHEQARLEEFSPAEILEADLAPLALELAGWNAREATQLRWLDAPPAGALAQARELLQRLGALSNDLRITPHGREMLALRVHPRLAHMLIRARAWQLTALACDIAALLSDRDVLRRTSATDADLRTRLDLLTGAVRDAVVADRGALERARRTAEQFRRQLGSGARHPHQPEGMDILDTPGALLALAYPDRVARAREDGAGRYVLSNGRGAMLNGPQPLARSTFLAIAELDGAAREAHIQLAAPLSRATLEKVFAEEIQTTERIRFDSRQRAVLAIREWRLGELVIDEKPIDSPNRDAVAQALLGGVREASLEVLPWTRDARNLQARVQFVRALPAEAGRDWPDLSDDALLSGLESWLPPWLEGCSRLGHLQRIDLVEALSAQLDHQQRRRLDELAPTHLGVPSGSRVRIDYLDGDTPVLAVRLQEMFGLMATPRIGGGAVPLLIKLLSPAQRPVQTTRDLASFWANGYAQVRKELKGRYPKHYWPEDPRQAAPRKGTRR